MEGLGFIPKLIIFDKDGTLIDFHAMWSDWVRELARRLETATHTKVADRLFTAVGFDPTANWVEVGGPLAIATMSELHKLTVDVLHETGLPQLDAQRYVASAWFVPDPVASARPLANLSTLFNTLHKDGVKIAVATTDDHAATVATLNGLGVATLVDAVLGGDDGVPTKPAPDKVLLLCQMLNVAPADTAMIGDTVADLLMGRAAGVGLAVGVLSGVGTAEVLQPHADLVLPSVAALVQAP
jgi:phosphoglycolate phosphatase